MVKHIEMIEEFLINEEEPGSYQFFDNHGLLIRCKDCKYFKNEELFGQHFQLCTCGNYEPRFVEPEHYCGYAEKKDAE